MNRGLVPIRAFDSPDGVYLNRDDVVKFLVEYGMNILDMIDDPEILHLLTTPLTHASEALGKVQPSAYIA